MVFLSVLQTQKQIRSWPNLVTGGPAGRVRFLHPDAGKPWRLRVQLDQGPDVAEKSASASRRSGRPATAAGLGAARHSVNQGSETNKNGFIFAQSFLSQFCSFFRDKLENLLELLQSKSKINVFLCC
jgi:hypothetical protein